MIFTNCVGVIAEISLAVLYFFSKLCAAFDFKFPLKNCFLISGNVKSKQAVS